MKKISVEIVLMLILTIVSPNVVNIIKRKV